MLLLELFGFGQSKTDKKADAARARVRAKEAAKIAADKKAKSDAAKQDELRKEIEAGEARRKIAAEKNTKRRDLKA